MTGNSITFDELIDANAMLRAVYGRRRRMLRLACAPIEELLAEGLAEHITLYGTNNNADRPLGVLIATKD